MYDHVCLKCNKEFTSKKKEQKYCCKSCANSVSTSNRKVEDISIFSEGLNATNTYILGLIYSDGCISYDKHTKRFRITISMNERILLEKIRMLMTPTKKLYTYKHPNGRENTYSVISTNPQDIEFLFKLGLTERKSLKISYPNILAEFDKDFIRGYFDGDGSVYKSTTNTYYKGVKRSYDYLRVKFTTGSKLFAIQLKECLEYHNILSKVFQDSRGKESYYVSIQGKEYVKKFHEYLYRDCDIWMERKYNKFIEMI